MHANLQGIGILPGDRPQYLDHLVPLCQMMGIPILVTEPWLKELIQYYYPPMEIVFCEAMDYSLDAALKGYETYFYVEFSRKANQSFQFHEFVTKHRARSVMSLHGNPDKYIDVHWLEKLCDEDIILAYGPQLVTLLQKKGVKKQPIVCGNYRLEFYNAHSSFFDSKLPFKKEKTTILYAPTWGSKEFSSPLRIHYSSFFDVYRSVFETLSEKFQLLVKLHPLTSKAMPDEVAAVKESYPQIHFLDELPIIYPLLKQVDIYLGDYSSIGYDFLYFDRPLFFLEPAEKTALHDYGTVIQRKRLNSLEKMIQNFERKKMYRYAFGEKKELGQLKQEIQNACRSYSH